MTNEKLLLKYRGGDALAFEELLEELGDAVYSYVANQVRDEHLATDITQDVWLRVLLRLDYICRQIERDPDAFNLKAYLFKMASNRVRDHWRRENRLSRSEDGDYLLAPDAERPPHVLSRDELLQCIARRMTNIGIRKQQAFWQTRDGGMTYAELARELHVATETVKDWVRQVLRAIRPCREEFDNA